MEMLSHADRGEREVIEETTSANSRALRAE
jgi:hypothetical protein